MLNLYGRDVPLELMKGLRLIHFLPGELLQTYSSTREACAADNVAAASAVSKGLPHLALAEVGGPGTGSQCMVRSPSSMLPSREKLMPKTGFEKNFGPV